MFCISKNGLEEYRSVRQFIVPSKIIHSNFLLHAIKDFDMFLRLWEVEAGEYTFRYLKLLSGIVFGKLS